MGMSMFRIGRTFSITLLGIVTLFAITCMSAQDQPQVSRPARVPVQSAKPADTSATLPVDVSGASAKNIQRIIEKLVSFGNRSTLSAQDPDSIAKGQGIGAAREWIKS